MKKILLLFCALISLNGIAQSWDFKTSQALGGWAKGTQTETADIVTAGVEVTWLAAKTPKILNTTAGINVANKIMAITVINNSTEPIAFRAKFPRNPPATGSRFYRGSSWDVVPSGTSTPTTYYFDLSGTTDWTDYGATLLNTFELQIGDTVASNTSIGSRDNASTAGNTIIIEKIEFLSAIPAAPGTITSAAAGDWDAGSTWVGGVVPASVNDVVINHLVRVKKNVTAEMASLSVGSSPGQLRIDNESIVKVTGSVSLTRNQDGIAMYAQSGPLGSFTYGSVDGGSTGKRIFVRPRLPANDKWSLISSPVVDSRINEIVGLNSPYIVTKDGKFSIASYDNSKVAGSKYVYYLEADQNYDHDSNAGTADILPNSAQIEEGEGHILKVNNSGDPTKPDYYQRGTLRTTFPVDIAITVDGTTGDAFNLLGNPLFGYLNVNDAADNTNNILRVNGSNGASGGVLAEDTIWLWDSVNETWDTKVLNGPSYQMPGIQGFFVKAKAGGGTFSFTKAMQSESGDAYQKSSANSNIFEINLSISRGKLNRYTSITFNDNASTSFDNGYDGSLFGGYTSSLELYTGLVEGDSAKKLAIQSLPNANYEDMIIPVGVTAEANSEITFTADAINVPAGYKVFLEDRSNSTFTRLDEANAKYTAIVSEKSTDGRFFLHTRSSVLSLDSELLNSVSIYKSDASTLRIVGLSQGKASVRLYNVLGEQVMRSNFNAKGVKELSLPKLSKGIYILQLETEAGKLNKKIVLE